MTRPGRYRWFITPWRGCIVKLFPFYRPLVIIDLAIGRHLTGLSGQRKVWNETFGNDSLIIFHRRNDFLYNNYDQMCNKSVEIRTQYPSSTTTTSVHPCIYILLIGLTTRATSRYVNQSYLSTRILELFGFMEYEHYPWNLSWQLAIVIRSDRCVFIASDCITWSITREKSQGE